MIKAESLSKSYRRNKSKPGIFSAITNLVNRRQEIVSSLVDVSFNVNRGEIVGLVGPNGSGKSTLIKLLTGIIQPTSGSVEVLGYVPSTHNNKFKKRIGVVLGKKSQLWWDLSPEETFLLHRKMYDIKYSEFVTLKDDLCRKMKVVNIIHTPVRTLSLGERMKCELICSLLHRPDVLFLDEPTIGLDFSSQKKIRAFLKEFVYRYETTIILTSHSTSDIEELCKRLLVLNDGKLIYDGDAKKMYATSGAKINVSLKFTRIIPQEILMNYGEIVEYCPTEASIRIAKDKYHQVLVEIFDRFSVTDFRVVEDDISFAISKLVVK